MGDRVEALVEFDYDAEEKDELTLRTGDIIKNVLRQNGGWWEGELNGKTGVFPDNFVKVIEPKEDNLHKRDNLAHGHKKEDASHGHHKKDDAHKKEGSHVKELKNVLAKQPGGSMHGPGPTLPGVTRRNRDAASRRKKLAKAAYSYSPENQDELRLEVGDVVEVINEEEEGWWRGLLRGQEGVFPSNFVEVINGSADVEENEKKEDDKPAEVTEIKAKKVRGVGLGNIFGGEAIKLKSTVVDKEKSSQAQEEAGPPRPIKPISPNHPAAALDRTEAAVAQVKEDGKVCPGSTLETAAMNAVGTTAGLGHQKFKVETEIWKSCEEKGVCRVQLDDSIVDTSRPRPIIELTEEISEEIPPQPFHVLLNSWFADSSSGDAAEQGDMEDFVEESAGVGQMPDSATPPVATDLNDNIVHQDFDGQPCSPATEASFTQVTDATLSPSFLEDDSFEKSTISLAKETPPPKLTFRRRRSLNDTPGKRGTKAMKQVFLESEELETDVICGKHADAGDTASKPNEGAGDASFVSATDSSVGDSFQLSAFDSELFGNLSEVLREVGFTGEEVKKISNNISVPDSGELVTPDSSHLPATPAADGAQNDSGLGRSGVSRKSYCEFHYFDPGSILDSLNVTKKRLSRLSCTSNEKETSMNQDVDKDEHRHVRFSLSPLSPTKEQQTFSDITCKLDLDEEPSLMEILNEKPEIDSGRGDGELMAPCDTLADENFTSAEQQKGKEVPTEGETYLESLKRRGKLPRSIGIMTNKYQLHKSTDPYGTLLADWKISGSRLSDKLWGSCSSPTVKAQEEHCPSQDILKDSPVFSSALKEKPVALVKPFESTTQKSDPEVVQKTKRSGCYNVIVVTDPDGVDHIMDVVEVPEHLRCSSSGLQKVDGLAVKIETDAGIGEGSAEPNVDSVDDGLAPREKIAEDELPVAENSRGKQVSAEVNKLEKVPVKVKHQKSFLQQVTNFFRSLMNTRKKGKSVGQVTEPTREEESMKCTELETDVEGSPKEDNEFFSDSPRSPPNSLESLSDGEVEFLGLAPAESDSLSDGEAAVVMKRPLRLLPDSEVEEESLVRLLHRGTVTTGSQEMMDGDKFVDLNKSVHTSTPVRSGVKAKAGKLSDEVGAVGDNELETEACEPEFFHDDCEDSKKQRSARKVKMILDYSAELKEAGVDPPKLPVSKEDLEASIHDMSSDELSFLVSNVVDGILTQVQHELERHQDGEEDTDDLGTVPLFFSDDDITENSGTLSGSASTDQHLVELLETTCDSEHAEPFYSIAYVSPNGTSYRFNC